MEILFASHNNHKLDEVRKILGSSMVVKGLQDYNFLDEIPETGTTLEENAMIKAKTIGTKFGLPCFADDTGLEIPALDGRPGVYSARYAGEPPNAQNNMEKVLGELSGIKDRRAQFRTVIAFYLEGTIKLFEGKVMGQLGIRAEGIGGFGYDPIFIPEESSQTFAQMSMEEKNNISHRARALESFKKYLNAAH